MREKGRDLSCDMERDSFHGKVYIIDRYFRIFRIFFYDMKTFLQGGPSNKSTERKSAILWVNILIRL